MSRGDDPWWEHAEERVWSKLARLRSSPNGKRPTIYLHVKTVLGSRLFVVRTTMFFSGKDCTEYSHAKDAPSVAIKDINYHWVLNADPACIATSSGRIDSSHLTTPKSCDFAFRDPASATCCHMQPYIVLGTKAIVLPLCSLWSYKLATHDSISQLPQLAQNLPLSCVRTRDVANTSHQLLP